MFAVYRLSLRDPAHLPAEVVNRLEDELPGVQIDADAKALVFMSERPDLGREVCSVVECICGDSWSDHFESLDNAPQRPSGFPAANPPRWASPSSWVRA